MIVHSYNYYCFCMYDIISCCQCSKVSDILLQEATTCGAAGNFKDDKRPHICS